MFCHKCGHQVPDDSKFCPKCGTSLLNATADVPKQERAIPPKNKYNSEMRVTPDPYTADPRWAGLCYYMMASLGIGIISTMCILLYFLVSDMHYDYQFSAFGFIGICISVVAILVVQAVSRPKLIKAFGNTIAADAILKHKSLMVNGTKCGSDDDIDFVN